MNNFWRESKERTRSERLIDRVILAEKGPGLIEKKQKVSEGESRPKQISLAEGFEKIKENLKKKNIKEKVLQTLKKFLKFYYMKINDDEVFECLKLIFDHDLQELLSMKCLSEILVFIQSSGILQKNNQKNQVEIWVFLSDIFSKMQTDDSILFHNALSLLEKKIDELEKSDDLLMWIGKSLCALKKYLSIPWARSSTSTFFKKCYLKLEIFESSAQETIISVLDSKRELKSLSEVPEILNPSHEIEDNRCEIITCQNTLDSWAHKQSGI